MIEGMCICVYKVVPTATGIVLPGSWDQDQVGPWQERALASSGCLRSITGQMESTTDSENEQWLNRRIASSVKKEEKKVQLIYKDISSLMNERDSLESKLLSVNELIAKKQRAAQKITSRIAAKKVIIGNTDVGQPAISKRDHAMKSQPILTNQLKSRLWTIFGTETPEFGLTTDDDSWKTSCWEQELLKDPMPSVFGYGDPQDVENQEQLTNCLMELTSKNLEPSGGTDICLNDHALSMILDQME